MLRASALALCLLSVVGCAAAAAQSDSRSVAYYAIAIKESYLPESDAIGLLGPDLDAPEPIQLAAIKSRDGTIFYALMDWNDEEVFGEVSATSLEHDPSILIAVSFPESGTWSVAIPVGYARAMVSRALSARFPGED